MFVIKSISNFLEGKEAMRKGTESFNKAASSSYKNLPSSQKEKMVEEASTSPKIMNSSDIKKEGKKIFGRIQKLVKKVSISNTKLSFGL